MRTDAYDSGKSVSVTDNTYLGWQQLVDYMNYKLDQLQEVTDKRKYNITFNLNKKDNDWEIETLSESFDREGNRIDYDFYN